MRRTYLLSHNRHAADLFTVPQQTCDGLIYCPTADMRRTYYCPTADMQRTYLLSRNRHAADLFTVPQRFVQQDAALRLFSCQNLFTGVPVDNDDQQFPVLLITEHLI